MRVHIFFIFILTMMAIMFLIVLGLLISTILSMDDEKTLCEEAGGEITGIGRHCLKQVNGDYYEVGTLKRIKGEWVFVRTGGKQ